MRMNWKVYKGSEFRASCKYIEEAACLVALIGNGSTIKFAHSKVMWTEGKETQPAAESYDFVAQTVTERVQAYQLQYRQEMAKRQAEFEERTKKAMKDSVVS